MSKKKKSFKLELNNEEIKVETESFPTQASGSCVVKLKDNTMLATAERSDEESDLPFFPLTCNYEERFYAAGEILGSRFVRREGKPSTKAVLTSRMVDRSIRPLFPEEFQREVQIIPTCLSWDEKTDPGFLALLASSISLGISDIPWDGPVGVARVAKVENDFIINPTLDQRDKADLDVFFSAVKKDDEVLVNMIEVAAQEADEDQVVEAFKFTKSYLRKIIEFQEEIIEEIGKEEIKTEKEEISDETKRQVEEIVDKKMEEAIFEEDDDEKLDALKEKVEEEFEKSLQEASFKEKEEKETQLEHAKDYFEKLKKKTVREKILEEEKRPDGRGLEEIRELNVKTDVLPRVHGSAIFSRGKTKALSVLTLGSPGDYLQKEGMEVSKKKRFFHQYNFPPYSVGEVKRLRAPGRREIGHGMLGEKALRPVVPDFDKFPYTKRVTSEILSSNGSTSMAATSAACMSLMSGGVPVKRLVAGIAVGLVKQDENYKVLTDIQGLEDHCGDMDFKVTGTKKGMTALQMDVKIKGIDEKIMKQALKQAKDARMEIIETQSEVISEPKEELSDYAPRVFVLEIAPDQIGNVIGPGGKTINKITEKFDVSIDIEDSGKVFIAGKDSEKTEKARELVKKLTKKVEVGEEYEGKVKKITDYGAFVEILPGKEGLVHISEFSEGHLDSVQDILDPGDTIPVKVIEVKDDGNIDLSAKDAGFKIEK